MIVALIALVFAMSGTAVAASKLVSGDSLVKKASLSGNRLRAHTLTGTQINMAKLGKVRSATQADSATNATHAASADSATHAASADSATNATHAASADTLDGIGPSAFGSDLRVMGDAFVPRDSGVAYQYEPYGGIECGTAAVLIYPLHLPQGAKITALTMYWDNTAGGSNPGSVTLYGSDFTNNSVLDSTPTGSTAGYGHATYTFSAPFR